MKSKMDKLLKILICLIIMLLVLLCFTIPKHDTVTDKYEQTILQYKITGNDTNFTEHTYYFLNTTDGEMMVDKETYDKCNVGGEANI